MSWGLRSGNTCKKKLYGAARSLRAYAVSVPHSRSGCVTLAWCTFLFFLRDEKMSRKIMIFSDDADDPPSSSGVPPWPVHTDCTVPESALPCTAPLSRGE